MNTRDVPTNSTKPVPMNTYFQLFSLTSIPKLLLLEIAYPGVCIVNEVSAKVSRKTNISNYSKKLC